MQWLLFYSKLKDNSIMGTLKNIDFNSKVKVKHITMPLCDVFKVRKHVRSLHCSTLITPQKILKTQLPPQKKNKSYHEKKTPNKQNSSNKNKIK